MWGVRGVVDVSECHVVGVRGVGCEGCGGCK